MIQVKCLQASSLENLEKSINEFLKDHVGYRDIKFIHEPIVDYTNCWTDDDHDYHEDKTHTDEFYSAMVIYKI